MQPSAFLHASHTFAAASALSNDIRSVWQSTPVDELDAATAVPTDGPPVLEALVATVALAVLEGVDGVAPPTPPEPAEAGTLTSPPHAARARRAIVVEWI